MSLPRFAYLAPATLSEALALAGADDMFVAAGTDLFVRMKERICTPGRVIGLDKIAELQGVDYSAEGGLRIGAATTLADLAEATSKIPSFQGFCDAIHLTSSPLLRNAGTIGGNLCLETRCLYYNQPPVFRKRWPLCLKLGGDICHAVKGSKTCHAVYSGDLAGILMVMNASATIAGRERSRQVAIEDLFTGSGLRPTVLSPGEILTEILIPNTPRHSGFSYQKLRLRDTLDFPILGVSLFMEFDPPEEGRRCRDARLVLSATGPSPLAIPEVGPMLKGREPTEKQIEEIGLLVKKAAAPVANTASSPKYRRDMIPVLTRRTFHSILHQKGDDR